MHIVEMASFWRRRLYAASASFSTSAMCVTSASVNSSSTSTSLVPGGNVGEVTPTSLPRAMAAVTGVSNAVEVAAVPAAGGGGGGGGGGCDGGGGVAWPVITTVPPLPLLLVKVTVSCVRLSMWNVIVPPTSL